MSGELIPYTGETSIDLPTNGRPVTSLDLRNRMHQALAMRAIQGSDFALDDIVGETIEVSHVLATCANYVNKETGEVSPGLRLVLIGPDGTRYSTSSPFVADDINRAVIIFGRMLPWDPAMRFIVRKPKSKAPGRSYLQLEPIIEGD
jgi:hypothetical protein